MAVRTFYLVVTKYLFFPDEKEFYSMGLVHATRGDGPHPQVYHYRIVQIEGFV